MKAKCICTYYDEELHRTVGKEETIEISGKRFRELSGKSNKAKKPLVEKCQAKSNQETKETGK